MNERRRSLTPQERREFEEIQARLSEEMSNIEVPPANWERWRRRATMLAAIAGLGLLIAGLLVTIVVVAFVGFALLTYALWRISNKLHLGELVARVRARLSQSPPDGRDGWTEPR